MDAVRLIGLPGVVTPPQFQIIQYQGDLPCGETVAVEYYYAAWNYYFETAFPDQIAAPDGGPLAERGSAPAKHSMSGRSPTLQPRRRADSSARRSRLGVLISTRPSRRSARSSRPTRAGNSSRSSFIQIPTGYGTGNGFCLPGMVALGHGCASSERTTTAWEARPITATPAKTVSASVNEVELGVFSQAVATPKFIGIEGTGFVNNFVVRKLP